MESSLPFICFKIFFFLIYVYVCALACGCLWKPEEDVEFDRAGVADNFKPPDIGAGKLVCFKSRK